MSNGNDNMKKTATVFSGLVFSFPLRLVITGASYAVVRFKLPPSEIGPFISILSNSMQITFILGILSINILIWCKVKDELRYISIVIYWLYLNIHLTMLIMIYSGDIKGNSNAYYWAMMIAGYLSGASGTCVLSVNGEYATIFTTTVPLSGMLMSGCNWIILKRISVISDYETSYKIIDYQIIIYIIMILITSILWTILFNVNADTNNSTTGNTTIVTMASIFGIFVSVCHWIILKYENGLLKYETSYKIINYQIIIYIIMILITSIIWLLGFNGKISSIISTNSVRKTATVFSGLVFSFPLRLVITGASYAVVRFKLPPSEIGPFISILSNSMQITFILGILSINILIWCKVQGNIIRYISIIINWLYLIIYLTMLIMIYSGDIKGNSNAYYWAMMIAGYLSGASGTCVLSVNGEYATIFTATVLLSGMLMSGCNWIILKRISVISDYETSYRIIDYQIIIYIIMILITSILWTILFIVNADTNNSTTGNTTIVTMASIFGIFVSVCHWIILKVVKLVVLALDLV
ncbi:Tpr related protein, putative [Babesia microti strain RI]|uniref:Tpr related protein, putative n=1 Tax=Babesia microti (strain RI) TaxID=1133968 RepID=A0A0K3APP2_BABMR|nr:Tpr related protein, putative [Babesia microti strain RI]CTQ40603.1 Tpr related protein, putative [Babesia microti strain RI]|eukprot:XP_012648614.1 Tpr related protein, putative [Babesia microti strain RI]